jgi:hypothetical protein
MSDARDTFHRLRIDPSVDFFTLGYDDIEALLAEADRVRYRKPKNANGSRARYFHARLERQLAREEREN